MQKPSHDLVSIISRRVQTEARLAALLAKAKSTATLDDIKRIIFKETPDERFSTYVAKLLALFENTAHAVDVDEALPIIQDAWNYFPHQRLDGECPAQVMARTIDR